MLVMSPEVEREGAVLPRKMVDPQGVGSEQLRRPRGGPVRQAVIILLRGLNLPAHDQEHDEDDGHLLGLGTDVGEGAKDVGKELGQRVRLNDTIGIGQRGEVGVVRPYQRLHGHALGRAVLAVLQEVEQDDVQRAGGGEVPRQSEVGDHVRGIHGVLATADIAGSRLLWRGQVRVDRPALAIVKEEVDAQALVKGHVRLDQGGARLLKG